MRRAFALVALLALPTVMAGKPPPMTAPYVGQPAGIACNFVLPGGLPCPDVPGSHVQFGPLGVAPERVDVALLDDAGVRVGGVFVLHDLDGVELMRGGFCESVSKIQAPPGVAFVRVVVDTAFTDQHCPNVVPLATTGTVSVRALD